MDNSNNQNSSNNPNPPPLGPSPFPPSTSPLPTSTPTPAWPTVPFPQAPDTTPTWAPSPSYDLNSMSSPPAEPAPTFTPPTSSPLDNPWGAPVQTPPFDQNTQPSQPAWVPAPNNTPVQPEPAPTDLSHLISSSSQPDSGQSIPSPSPETLVVSSTSAPEVPTLPIEDRKSIPKWLIGVGVSLLIIVTGTSAYFILGIGQPAKTTSVPAEVTSTKQTVKTPPPIATPIPQAAPAAATGSANFGDLQGAPAASPKQATRAGDLLK